ncbi:MAG: hemerythrin domain-containing protein [Vitreoscilla sp.]
MAVADPLDPPLDVLVASHRRARQQFETMRELATRAPEAPVDAVARRAGQAVICAVDQSIRLHHEVEQGVLFPELIESMAGSDPVCLREMIAGLTEGHRALASAWGRLRPAFAALAEGRPANVGADDVAALIAQGERVFRREDDELLPMANRLLSDEARHRVAAAMQRPGRDRTT